MLCLLCVCVQVELMHSREKGDSDHEVRGDVGFCSEGEAWFQASFSACGHTARK